MILLEQPRHGFGERLGLVVSRWRIQRDINLKALGTRCLRIGFEAHLLKGCAHPQPHLATLHDVGWRPGIKVKHERGWPLDVATQRE